MLVMLMLMMIAIMVMVVMLFLPFRVVLDPFGMVLGHPVRVVLVPPIGVVPGMMAIIVAHALRESGYREYAAHRRDCE